MDASLYQHPEEQSLLYYHCSPPFATGSFDYLGAAATPPSSAGNDSPEVPVMRPQMEQPPATGAGAGGNVHCVGVDGAAVARKDRHSKICTAGGMRDRRMRLSLNVAREFFKLQDMLGFDKASKTVQWLLNTSKGAIREIGMTDGASSEYREDDDYSSSLSAVDGKNRPPPADARCRGAHKSDGSSEGKKPSRGKKPAAVSTNPKPSRKSGNAHLVPDKELRAKARNRARERTKEKNRMRWVTLASAINVEPAAGPASLDKPNPDPSNSTRSSSMASPELEEKCSSEAPTVDGATLQEMSPASDVILAFGYGGFGAGAGSSSYYHYQEQSELGQVVFSNNSRASWLY